jgi:hypothetical protein
MQARRLEAVLSEAGCVKTIRRTARACIWRAPNGRRFSAPDPSTVYLVPTRSQERILGMLDVIKQLPPPPKLPLVPKDPPSERRDEIEEGNVRQFKNP